MWTCKSPNVPRLKETVLVTCGSLVKHGAASPGIVHWSNFDIIFRLGYQVVQLPCCHISTNLELKRKEPVNIMDKPNRPLLPFLSVFIEANLI